jgi:hypothetical protein
MFMVTPDAVQAFFSPMAQTLIDPVTHDLDVESGRRMFDEVLSKTLHFIAAKVAEQGGTVADIEEACEFFISSLEASFRGIQ